MTQLDFFAVLETTICKDDWTFDYALTQPDTPDIAARRNTRQTSLWFLLGRHGVGAVAA